MKYLAILIPFLVLGCDQPPVKETVKVTPQPVIPGHVRTVEDAVKSAKEQGKFAFVRFTASWCGPCQQLERDTLSNGSVKEFLRENAVELTLDGDRNRETMNQYRVHGFPTVLILDGNGKERGRIIGYRPAKAFLAELKLKARR